jgi:hypothetical protein
MGVFAREKGSLAVWEARTGEMEKGRKVGRAGVEEWCGN